MMEHVVLTLLFCYVCPVDTYIFPVCFVTEVCMSDLGGYFHVLVKIISIIFCVDFQQVRLH